MALSRDQISERLTMALHLKAFEYQHAGEIIFGNGRISEVGSIVSRYGRRCLIVSGPKKGALRDLYPIVGELLEHLGLEWEHFDGVIPNPTVDLISTGAKIAKTFKADVVLGIGGGSSLDAAKAISVEATHEGTSWDYVFFKQRPTARTLPVVAVGTTAGSGSQVTPLAAITNTSSRDKSALCSDRLIPRAAIVDPQLMLSVPVGITAATGFAVFCQAFESILNPRSNPLTELFGWEAVGRVIKDLPVAVREGSNLGARSSLAWADTLAGFAACGSGLVLPHGIAMAVGSLFADIPHGMALVSVYRACLEFTWASAVSTFARLAHLLDPALDGVPASDAAERCPDLLQAFLARIDVACTLRDFGISKEELPALAKQSMVLPDYKNNPRVPTPDEMLEIIAASF
jgi:alcohol dehydrogenase class IV